MLQVWTAEKPHPQEEVRDVWMRYRFNPKWHYFFLGSLSSFSFYLVLCSVPGLSLGPDPEVKERPLAGAPHPSPLHCFWQRAVRGPAAQPAPLHPSRTHAWHTVPHAPSCLPHVWLHWCPRGTREHFCILHFVVIWFEAGSPSAHHQGPVMPGSHSVERFVIEENLHCIIKTHWKERKTWCVTGFSLLNLLLL